MVAGGQWRHGYIILYRGQARVSARWHGGGLVGAMIFSRLITWLENSKMRPGRNPRLVPVYSASAESIFT